MAKDKFEVDVVYALPGEQWVVRLTVAAGTTVEQAIQQSGLPARYPAIDLGTVQSGVFGRKVPANTRLAAGDRVEIYRPLTVDPKEARRRRAIIKSTKKSNT